MHYQTICAIILLYGREWTTTSGGYHITYSWAMEWNGGFYGKQICVE